MTRVVYVENMGGWWRFTPKGWQEWVKQALKDIVEGPGYFSLPEEKMLRRRPRVVKVFDDEPGRLIAFYSDDPGVRIARPHDWTALSFYKELSQLDTPS